LTGEAVEDMAGTKLLFSLAYIWQASPYSFKLLVQLIRFARSSALDNTGKRIAARIAMMAMTTSSSINVKPAGKRQKSENGAICLCRPLTRFIAWYLEKRILELKPDKEFFGKFNNFKAQ
jgi:hypothetical protein